MLATLAGLLVLAQQTDHTAETSSGDTVILIIVIVAVLVGLGGGLFFMTRRG